MNRKEAARRLKEYTRIDIDEVLKVIGVYARGGRPYEVYERLNIVAKGTALKLHRLYKDNLFDFLEELDTSSLIKEFDEKAEEKKDDPNAYPLDGSKGRAIFSTLGLFNSNLSPLENKFKQIKPQLPKVEWNFGWLKGCEIPDEIALELLIEYDNLQTTLETEVTYHNVHRFVALHYIVFYYLKVYEVPEHKLIEWAAVNYAEGLINNNSFLQKLADGFIRYEVWRGDRFRDALFKALEPNNKEMKHFEDMPRPNPMNQD